MERSCIFKDRQAAKVKRLAAGFAVAISVPGNVLIRKCSPPRFW